MRHKASKVKVTKADGTDEIRNAYNKYDLKRVLGGGSSEPGKQQGNPKIGRKYAKRNRRP